MHVATTTVPTLLDYVKNTPQDPLFSHRCVEQRLGLIRRNRAR
jgi:4-O-beta-D-mannosyl-D-glucose phosphorylase